MKTYISDDNSAPFLLAFDSKNELEHAIEAVERAIDGDVVGEIQYPYHRQRSIINQVVFFGDMYNEGVFFPIDYYSNPHLNVPEIFYFPTPEARDQYIKTLNV